MKNFMVSSSRQRNEHLRGTGFVTPRTRQCSPCPAAAVPLSPNTHHSELDESVGGVTHSRIALVTEVCGSVRTEGAVHHLCCRKL
jgi:hypothetical protein